jgi:hypothetical protein
MIVTPDQELAVLNALVETARRQPNGRLFLRGRQGETIAVVEAHSLPTRPQDMPRSLRPKLKLSKRQRTAAKYAKRD